LPTALEVCGICFVLLLCQLGTNVYAARQGGLATITGPDGFRLTKQKLLILFKRPDHPGASDAEWLAWHEAFKDQIDTRHFMHGRLKRTAVNTDTDV
jgi:hypothetical protein